MGVTTPIAGIGVMSLKVAGDFEASMNRVKAISGATGEEFTGLRDLAKDMGAKTQYSASQAAEAMGFLAMSGFKVKDITEALPGVLSLAAAGQLELAEAADLASNILSGYGLKAKDLGRINDILAKTFTSTNTDLRMLGDSFKYAGPVASSAGLQFEEVSAAIGLMGNAGIQGEMAGTALRGSISRLLKPTRAVSSALDRLGVEVVDSHGQMLPMVNIVRQLEKAGANTADMMTIFGLEAGPAMQALVSQGSGALADLTAELENSGGTAAKIAKTQMEGLNGSVDELSSAFEGLMIAIGDAGILDFATDLVKRVTALTSAAGQADPALLRTAIAVAAVAAAVGPVLVALGLTVNAVGQVMDGFQATGKAVKWVSTPLTKQVAAWRAQAAAVNTSTAAMIVHNTWSKIVRVSAIAWTAAQVALNWALKDNPIGIVVTVLALLVGAIILAYRNSETFRKIVQAAWAGIQAAAKWAWEKVLQPAFRGITKAITDWVVPAFLWLWSRAKTVWAGVSNAVKVSWAFLSPIFAALQRIVGTVLAVAFRLFSNTVKIAWIAIQVAFKIGWAYISTVFNLWKTIITKVVAPAVTWLWRTIVAPAWKGMRIAISTAWTIIRAVFYAVRSVLTTVLGPAFKVARTVITTAWNGVRTVITTVWNSWIRPSFDRLKSAVGKVKDAFKVAVDGIKTHWDRIKDISKKPVNFVIGIYNRGIVDLVNRVAKFAGISTRLDRIPALARGGVLPGYAPGRDTMLAAVSPGESIFRPEFTRAVGAGWVRAVNDIARRRGVAGVRDWLRGPDRLAGEGMGFAGGGVVPFAGRFGVGGIIGKFVKGVKDFTIGNVGDAAEKVLDRIIGTVPGQGTFRDVVAAIPPWIKGKVLGWIKGTVDDASGGQDVRRALSWAKAQVGRPYVWGGVGPGGYDCSGITSAVTNVLQGLPPHRRRFTTSSFAADNAPAGFVRGLRSAWMVGVTHRGVGHMGGTLAGIPIESSGGAGVRVGGGARGANHPMFTDQYGLRRDDGGRVPPGLSLVRNGTGRDEWMFTDAQLRELLDGRGTQVTYNIYPQRADLNAEDLRAITRRQEIMSRAGRPG